MKKVLPVTLCVISMLNICGCKEHVYGNEEERFYTLDFVFVNDDGESLVNELPVIAGDNRGYISHGVYNMTVNIGNETFVAPKDKLLRKVTIGGVDQLRWNFVSIAKPLFDTVNMTLSCKRIFGNMETHTIVSKWNEPYYMASPECKKVIFDGKEYPVIYNPDTYTNVVTIKIDNQ